ncbi:Kelch-like protein 26 [Branchiostoma belcheri]|nr:Kelch-like protein 26 [Branchiostoma belcheri]
MADNYYSRSYVSDEHSDSLLRGLNALRSDSLLCDVTLVADDQGFQAHRAVLASCSDYFKAMFTSGMRESSETHVELKGVSANGLQHVLDFAYTSRLGLSLQIVQDVIGAASHLQHVLDFAYTSRLGLSLQIVQDVIGAASHLQQVLDFAYTSRLGLNLQIVQDVIGAASHLQALPIIIIVEKFLMAEINVDVVLPIIVIVEKFLMAEINVDNCLAIGQIAANYDLSSVTNQVNNFILLHFKQQVSQIDDFLSLPHERIADLLGSDWLHGCSEVEIFHIALRWLRHDPARMAHASQVMEHIRFPLMSPGDLVDQVQSVDIMDSDSACRRFLLEAFNYQTLPYRQHELQSPRTSVRSILKAIVCIGGTPYTDDRVVKDKLRNLRYCPRQVRETAYFSLVRSTIEYGAVIWDPYLRKDIDTLEMVNRRAARFVTSNHRRQHVSVTALLHDLRWPSLQSRRQQARLVMMYKITNGLVAIPSSRLIPAVARTRANHAHKYKTLRPHCDIAKYSFYARTIPEWNNLSADRWFEIGPMEEGRCHHGVAIMDNFIYVVGGQAIQYPSGDGAVATCSRYDVWTGTWVRMKSMHEKRAHFHLSALGGRLYAVGGRNKEQNLKSVEAFLPRENSTGHAGCVCDGKLYTSGGYGTSMNNVPHERVLQFYDPEQNAWQCRAPMTTGRIWHCMATLADKLYVMGGDIGDARLHVLTAESYCPASDQWTSIAPMLTGQSEAGTAVIDDKIFLLGGYDWNNRDVIGSVQSYRPEENIWRREASLPQAAAGVACCVVKLPSRYGAMVED